MYGIHTINRYERLVAMDFKKRKYTKLVVYSIVIAVFLFWTGFYVLEVIEDHYHEIKKNEAIKMSEIYSTKVRNSSQAYTIINDLLEDKILVASQMSSLEALNMDEMNLGELSERLKVDRIYHYNSQGEIIKSSANEYIGWKAYEGHPIYDFILSGSKLFIEEDIRKDTGSPDYYKYGYYRLRNGGFVQIGIHAYRIAELLSNFEIDSIIDATDQTVEAKNIDFINTDYKVIATTRENISNEIIDKALVEKSILGNKKTTITQEVNDNRIFKVYAPVTVQSNIIGVLAMTYSLERTDALIAFVSKIGIGIFVFFYFIIIYILIMSYKKESQLINLAYFDALTGFPNIDYFIEVFNEALKKPSLRQKSVVVLKFTSIKTINMTHGYRTGTTVLKEVANRLKIIEAEENISIFKPGGIEFMLYLKNSSSKEKIITYIDRINNIFSKPFIINGIEQYLKLKIGVVEIDKNHNQAGKLLKEANIIINNISLNSKNNYAFFNKEMTKKLCRSKSLENEMRSLIKHDNKAQKLFLNFQPLIDTKSEKVKGFEALARFKSEKFGNVSPLEFIQIAEKYRLIIPLSNIIIKDACLFIKELEEKGYKDVKVAVNISAAHLIGDNFITEILDIIEATNINPSNLELEITESILMNNFELINNKLETLQEKGIKISLDDFGTGYSSFARFGELNINYLKIDKYFIDKILTKNESDLIAGEIITMAHKFNIKVVAEGVEESIQREYLEEKNCDLIQGYYYSKPLIKTDALNYLKSKN